MNDYLDLTYAQVGLAALLILINGVVSVVYQLGLEKSLLIASIRTIAQLLLIGLVLEWIFAQSQLPMVIGVMTFMTVVAGMTATQRLKRTYRGIWVTTIIAMFASSWIVAAYAITLVFQGIEPWYRPQYTIPILGMILGNTLNGISIGLASILDSVISKRGVIEMRLSLGANRWEAVRPELQHAISTGMIPIINSMMIVGLVSLPGMMTGQLLSGTSPVEAVKYQIAIMFLIASATALGTVLATVMSCRQLLNNRHQLEAWRLR